MTCVNYPAPGKANLFAEIEERLELLEEIYRNYEPMNNPIPSVESAMSSIVGLYGYSLEEYQYGAFMA